MKLKNAIIHAAVVSALAAGVAGSAHAVGQWNAPYTGTVLATEVFGDTGNNLSNETLITAPARTYNVLTALGLDTITQVAGPLAGGPSVLGTYVDIKFTLSGGAVFGEAMNDNTTSQILKFLGLEAQAAAAAAAGAAVAIPAANIDSDLTGATTNMWHAVVMSGGAIGDNTVAVRIFHTDATPEALNLSKVTFGGYKVKNLKPALDKDSSHTVVLGVNYTPTTGAATAETTTPAALFASQDAIRLALTPANITAANSVSWYINAADDRKKFAITPGAGGASDFTSPGLTTVGTAGAQLATLQLMSGTTANAGVNALREDLTNFVFMGGDNIVVTLDSSTNGTFNAFKAPGAITLTQGTCAVPAAPTVAGSVSTDGKTAAFNVSALTDAQLNLTYQICATANGTAIDEQNISASAAVDFLNVRYWDRNVTAAGPVITRVNGESQAVPYVLSSGNAYQTYLRVANNSSKAGRVTVQCRKNGSDATANQAVTTGVLANTLGANNAKFFTASDVAAACGANGATAGTDYSYVIVRGEFQYMDAGQYMFNPNGGVVTQLNTNSTTGRVGINGNSLNAY